jgi:hypothetical protein
MSHFLGLPDASAVPSFRGKWAQDAQMGKMDLIPASTGGVQHSVFLEDGDITDYGRCEC